MQRHRRNGAGVNRAALVGGGIAAAGLGLAGYAAASWLRYGRKSRQEKDGGPDLLDQFIPEYEVSDRHSIEIAAPAELVYQAAREMDINRAPLIRGIFAVRSLPARLRRRRLERAAVSLVEETSALGWELLAEVPDRLLIMGAYTRPWEASVVFHGVPAAAFRDFDEPGYAKIVWTLEVEPLSADRSRFTTRTRVVTTDQQARKLFRRYWTLVAPGVRLIRRSSLGLIKRTAERQFRQAGAVPV